MAAEAALAAPARHAVTLPDGRPIYEWSQSLADVDVFLPAPPGAPGSAFDVALSHDRVRLGLKRNPPYIDHALGGRIKTSESFWTVEDSTLHLHLAKASPGEPWAGALADHPLPPPAAEGERQRLLLERFQGEHPGFDFSGAAFSGAAPDPRTFLREDE